MIRHTPMAVTFTLALIASSATISVKASAQERVPQQSLQLENSPDEPSSRGSLNVKAILKLTAEQEKLWSPVEDAVRNLQERAPGLRSSGGDGANDQMDRLRRMADFSVEQANALKTLADAVQPLWATLSDEQKRLLPRLIGVATGRNDDDRMTGRGRDAGGDPNMGRRQGGDGRDDPRHMMGRGDDTNDQPYMGRRQGGDRRDHHRHMMGRGDDTNDQPYMGRRQGGDGDHRRMMGRGDDFPDQSSMGRRHGAQGRDDRPFGENRRSDGQWIERDDHRAERFARSFHRGSRDDDQLRGFARDGRDFDRRADRYRCGGYERD